MAQEDVFYSVTSATPAEQLPTDASPLKVAEVDQRPVEGRASEIKDKEVGAKNDSIATNDTQQSDLSTISSLHPIYRSAPALPATRRSTLDSSVLSNVLAMEPPTDIKADSAVAEASRVDGDEMLGPYEALMQDPNTFLGDQNPQQGVGKTPVAGAPEAVATPATATSAQPPASAASIQPAPAESRVQRSRCRCSIS